MEFINKTVIKYAKCFFIPVLILLTLSVSGCSSLHGRFIELNFEQEDNNQPVRLSDHEVFFAGGYTKSSKVKNIPAKIYNVKLKQLISLEATLNYPRINYGAIKYDDKHILIVGGRCAGMEFNNPIDCSKVAEIYDIKKNKFTRIEDTNLSYIREINTILLNDGRVFIYSDGMFEIFNPKDNKFLLISGVKIKHPIDKTTDIYTNNFYVRSKAMLLNDKEILIFGYPPQSKSKMEILNIETGDIKDIPIDKGILIDGAVKISDGSVLFIGLGKEKNKVNRFDPKTRTISYMPDMEKPMAGAPLLLSNDNILLIRGGLDNPDYFRPTILARGIYDYKNNKVYARKLSHTCSYSTYLVSLNNNTVYISGYENNRPMLYKY